MKQVKRSTLGLFAMAAVGLWWLPVGHTEEGMWTLSDLPKERMQQRYNFDPGPDWVAHVQKAAVRLGNGCSGSFVSPQGLVMTNHHCALSCITEQANAVQDTMKNGFYAASRELEKRCTGMELNQLVGVEDVTPYVQSATHGLSGEQYGKAQRAELSKIEKQCSEATGLRCDVVNLYHGAKYHLYRYKRFSDVRLVFAPESQAASFGGDPDNFSYPRYALDVAYLRAYENNQPISPERFLAYQPNGARKEGELVMAVGHPGSTQRLLTVAQLEYQRDVVLPERLLYLAELRGRLTELGKKSTEAKRQIAEPLQRLENSYKASYGMLQTLHDRDLMTAKQASERAIREQVSRDGNLQQEFGGAWDALATAQERARRHYKLYSLLEGGTGFSSELFRVARTLVRAAEERQKPNGERLREYRDTILPSLTQRLLSKQPVYSLVEEATLAYGLGKLRERLGPDHAIVKKVLGQEAPEELAKRLIAGSRLFDVSVRKQLFDGGAKAVDASQDPLIALAKKIDGEARTVRKAMEDEVESVLNQQGERVARALFSVVGTSVYPDATFSLRLTYGSVKGYEADGQQYTPWTMLGGAFDRHTGREPFVLPQTWLNKKGALKADTPLDFVSTLDIIGGNSGSPVINRDAQIVGLAFDGNLQSLGGAYHFDEKVNRCISVHAAGLLEALRVIYRADRVLREIVVLDASGKQVQMAPPVVQPVTTTTTPPTTPAAPATTGGGKSGTPAGGGQPVGGAK